MNIYYFLETQLKNAGIVVAYDRWPIEVLANRGWLDRQVYARPATPRETAISAASKRFVSYAYRGPVPITALMEDEKREPAELTTGQLTSLEAALRRNEWRLK